MATIGYCLARVEAVEGAVQVLLEAVLGAELGAELEVVLAGFHCVVLVRWIGSTIVWWIGSPVPS
jgi:hypothetical protein